MVWIFSKKIKQSTLLILFIAFTLSLYAQQSTGSIKGTITTSDGKPGESVNISLQRAGNTVKAAKGDDDGKFLLRNIQPGQYDVVASLAGLATQTKSIELLAGRTLEVNFVLSENYMQLQDVVISSGANRFSRQQSQDVGKLPLKNVENPQVYSVITSGLMKDQQNINISQALSNAAGVVPSKDPAGGTSFTLRGFTAEVAARNGILFIGAGRSGVDPVNVDHFEVLKGPSAVLFGNTISSYGGAVNMVTKKPFDTFKGEVSYSFGGFDLNRVTVDINTPLTADKTVLLRTNAAINREGSYLQTGHNNTSTFAPGLLYKASDKLTLSADVEIYREDLNRTPYLRFNALGINNVNKLPLGYTSTLYNDGLNAVTSTFRSFFTARYQFSDHWYSQTDVAVNTERVEHSFQYYPTFLDATHIQRQVACYGPITTANRDIQHNLHGDFHTGPIRHRFVWGLDYTHTTTDFNYNFATVDTIDIAGAYAPMTRSQADRALLDGSTGSFPSKINQYATYVSDLANITDNLMVLLSARFDHYNQTGAGGYKQSSVTPKLGLIYQPVKNRLSVFGNYMSGFTNQGPTVQPDGSVLKLKPEFATQWEGGIKVDAGNRLSATVSYYSIHVRDAVRYEGTGFAFQDGKQKSNGVEVSLTANPVTGLNLIVGYVYNKNQYTRAAEGVGKDVSGTPRSVANFWASYKFQAATVLQNFGLGFGGNYAQKSYYDLENTVIIPSFTLFNASLFYDRPRFRVGISGNNLGDKHYWSPSFTANPQALRQIIANVTVKF